MAATVFVDAEKPCLARITSKRPQDIGMQWKADNVLRIFQFGWTFSALLFQLPHRPLIVVDQTNSLKNCFDPSNERTMMPAMAIVLWFLNKLQFDVRLVAPSSEEACPYELMDAAS